MFDLTEGQSICAMKSLSYLHNGLGCIDGHEKDAEQTGSDGRRKGLYGRGKVHVLEGCKYTGVGGCVTKPAKRSLRGEKRSMSQARQHHIGYKA